MRDFSKVSPSVWRSRKFRTLPDDSSRLVYMYLLTCPHGNSAGCFDLHPMYACADLEMTEKVYRKAIDSLKSVGLIAFDVVENTLFLENWFSFNQPTNYKHALGLLSQLQQASSRSLKIMALENIKDALATTGFEKYGVLKETIDGQIQTLSKGYQEGIPRETETETETETEMERETPRAPPLASPDLETAVAEWNQLHDLGIERVQNFTKPRKDALKRRMPDIGGMPGWSALIGKIRASPFLKGKNDRGWKVTFDWVLNPKNMTKIMEGNYDDRTGHSGSNDIQRALDDERSRVHESGDDLGFP